MLTWRGWVILVVACVTLTTATWVGWNIAKDLWVDHQQHHAIWELELRRAQAATAPTGGS